MSTHALEPEGRAELTAAAGDIVVIEPVDRWWRIDVATLWKYRELLMFLVWRDVKGRYAQSALGIGWAVVQPLTTTIVFTVVFGMLAEIESDGIPYPLFSYIGLIGWTYFSRTLTESTGSLVRNANMLKKIYFPRLLLPVVPALTRLLDFSIAAVLAVPLLIYYQVRPTAWALFIPVLVLIMGVAAAGLGAFLTALAIQYRDVQHGMSFGIHLMMYASPVVYPVSAVPAPLRPVYALNPMVGVIEGFRASLIGSGSMPWELIGLSAVSATVLIVVGVLYFQRRESLFADVA